MDVANLTPVLIPQTGMNDEHVTVSQFYVEPGDAVSEGDLLFSIVTSKADFDVEAEGEGYFWPAVEVGDRVDVGAAAAYLSATPERPDLPDRPEPPAAETGAPRATRKAEARAKELGVDLGQIEHRGILRVRDVEAFAREQQAGAAEEAVAAEPASDGAAGGAPEVATRATEGRLDPAFLVDIREPESGFAALSSDLKVRLYRRFGAVIGEGTTFAPGAAIYAESVEVGPGCTFGAGTVVQAERFRVGAGGLFGRDNDIMCRRIEIGDMLFLVNRVLVGQGGAFNEEAALEVGHSCLISSDCLINTAHRVQIGDVSCLSPRVSLYTHSHWQNVLEGYHATFAPITVGEHVWITGGCLVTPGAVVEDGAQVLANSVVIGRVPARTIMAGVPAKAVSEVRGDLSPAERDRIVRTRVWPAIEKAVREAGLDLADVAYRAHQPASDEAAAVQLAFGPRPDGYAGTYFDLSGYHASGPQTPLSDEVRNALRKQGIRFEPHRWRYRADVGRFNA